MIHQLVNAETKQSWELKRIGFSLYTRAEVFTVKVLLLGAYNL